MLRSGLGLGCVGVGVGVRVLGSGSGSELGLKEVNPNNLASRSIHKHQEASEGQSKHQTENNVSRFMTRWVKKKKCKGMNPDTRKYEKKHANERRVVLL